MSYQPVIGLEVHAQLATASKIFSASPTRFGAEPNTQASLIDLGMPGVLPVLNKEAVTMAVKFGLAIGAEIGRRSVFARKNYFYPDLPKGYQISQFEHPVVGKGELDITLNDGSTKRVGITRAHLEEDAGKSLHDAFDHYTGIDLNRAGTPLLEIVSEPDMFSAEEALAYAKKLHALVQYIGICDGNMQEGSFRMDVNISLRKTGTEELGTRAEIKNLNSFKFMEKAIAYEMMRQSDLLDQGKAVVQETRLFDVNTGETRSMRSKEESHDYRYFPCPDLLPVVVDEGMIDVLRETLPELPDARKQRYQDSLGLDAQQAETLTASRELSAYFEAIGGELGYWRFDRCPKSGRRRDWKFSGIGNSISRLVEKHCQHDYFWKNRQNRV
jgi:aspartyl-tRNA(Asn)/glutamyl-tRNA(Gln) amidotransferase subunit B